MEIKVNLFLLGALGLIWASFTLAEPAAALDPQAPSTQELSVLEDAFAADPGDADLARGLADHYLALNQPGLVVATLSSAHARVRQNPSVLHRLAQAYEETGRLADALSTAELAQARCGRALGSPDAAINTPAPAVSCTHGVYAALEVHTTALTHMLNMGITDTRRDPRTLQAYGMAIRTARIYSASASNR